MLGLFKKCIARSNTARSKIKYHSEIYIKIINTIYNIHIFFLETQYLKIEAFASLYQRFEKDTFLAIIRDAANDVLYKNTDKKLENFLGKTSDYFFWYFEDHFTANENEKSPIEFRFDVERFSTDLSKYIDKNSIIATNTENLKSTSTPCCIIL